MEGKRLVSFDVQSLLTNVLTEGALEAVKRTIADTPDDNLPISKK